MISLGRNITVPNDPLYKISVKYLADKIKQPDVKFVDFIGQLRKVQQIDTKKYRQLKTRLPYVVGALFNPNYRKIENFAHCSFFIIDIDHLSDKEIDITNLLERLKTDERVVLAFRSPSDDGLKVFFKLCKPFYDHGKYSLFYKIFTHKFALEYSLDQVVDKRTSDVSRACFVSFDPELWYNENATCIDANKYINFDNELQINEIKQELKEKEKNDTLSHNPESSMGQNIPDDIISKIRETLNPKIRLKKERQITVPEELDTIIELIKIALLEYKIEIEEIVNINYGKQFRLKLHHYKAEINVFYGKRGFTIVKSNKSICNKELVDVAYDIIDSTIL